MRLNIRKYSSFVLLVVQNAAIAILISESKKTSASKGAAYSSSVAVLMSEVAKVVLCLIMGLITRDLSFETPSFQVLVPAGLYAVQNTLLYEALAHLDPATYQATYQLKLLTAAFFSVIMCGTRLSMGRWISLCILTLGVSIIQLDKKGTAHWSSPARGFAALFAACAISGFAGAWFERILRGDQQKKVQKSLWTRNLQLAMPSIFLALLGTRLSADWPILQERGILMGFEPFTWVVVLMNAFGGILVSIVVRDLNSVLKGFATSLAIVLSLTLSVFLHGFQPGKFFLIGSHLVLLSTGMYALV